MSLTPEQFVNHWHGTQLKESASYSTHFDDVCELLDLEKPAHAVLAAYGWPADISDDDILARLLEENLKREPAGGKAEAEEDEKPKKVKKGAKKASAAE